MQTFYGMADLFVVGLYDGAKTTTAVAIGSQVTHMLTVILVGLAMGGTVRIGRAIGARNEKEAAKTVSSMTIFFAGLSLALTAILCFLTRPITSVMMTPSEAVPETVSYLRICFAGIPFITAYNVISSILRGAGDSKRPMYFVAIACVSNVALDFVFVGLFGMGAPGAALATISAQAISVVLSLLLIRRQKFSFMPGRREFRLQKEIVADVLKVGGPIALQDGLIQVSFVVITIIANGRGLIMASGVGIVEKLISFLFLVPSAFLSAISAITAQNMGAQKSSRATKSLLYGLAITVSWGAICFITCQIIPRQLVGIFTRDGEVARAGAQYLRSYGSDCMFAAIHFCFSGYFAGIRKSGVSFFHNMLSVLLIRIPGAYFTSKWYPDTLLPMGMAAPIGSLVSDLICLGFFMYYIRKDKN